MDYLKSNTPFSMLVFILVLATACGTPPVAMPEMTKSIEQGTLALSSIATVPATSETPIIETSPIALSSPTPELVVTKVTTPSNPTQEGIAATPSHSSAVASVSSPTPTFIPLSPLDENLQTIVYTINGEQGPEIYRVQVDDNGQKVGPVEQVGFPSNSRTQIYGLFPSPDKLRIAIGWVYSESGTRIDILDVASGQLTPLLGVQSDKDLRATFLDWTPDGQNILVMGELGSELSNSAWLVDIKTHVYQQVNIKQEDGLPTITSASFSPDGETVVYAQSACNQCGGEVWSVSVSNSNQRLLFRDSDARIENVSWSPNGEHIAFTKWVEANEWVEFSTGELHIIDPDGNEQYQADSAVTHYFGQFRPDWSPDSQQIVFVRNEGANTKGPQLSELSSNLFFVNIPSGQVSRLTNFDDTQVMKPTWLPDGSQIAFLTTTDNLSNKMSGWVVDPNGMQTRQLGLDTSNSKPQSQNSTIEQSGEINIQSLVWLQ